MANINLRDTTFSAAGTESLSGWWDVVKRIPKGQPIKRALPGVRKFNPPRPPWFDRIRWYS